MGTDRRDTIVTVGSALVDILARADEGFLASSGGVKGGMIYVEREVIERTVSRLPEPPAVVPGGSACNTAVGVARLGGRARFVGKRGRGRMGDFLERALRENRVEPRLFGSEKPTGRVLSVVTPDAQRSMFTFLGAAAEARPEEIAPELFADAAIVHIEGYLLYNPALIRRALEAARDAGARISLDLASHNVVAAAREELARLVRDYVDILLANEDESRAYTGEADPGRALEALRGEVEVAVVKLGARGSLIAAGAETHAVPARGDGRALDTTGAGDLWAAGFLYGLVRDRPLPECGAIGSACGYEVCQVLGASIPEEGWRRIRRIVESLGAGSPAAATNLSPPTPRAGAGQETEEG